MNGDVEAIEISGDGLHQRPPRGVAGHIEIMAFSISPRGPDRLGGGDHTGRIAIGGDHRRAVAAESQGHGPANTGGGASDQRDF